MVSEQNFLAFVAGVFEETLGRFYDFVKG